MVPHYARSEGQRDARNVVQKLAQRLHCIASDEVELVDEDLSGLVCDGGRRDGEGFVGEEVAIVRCGQLCPEVYKTKEL